MTHAAKALRPSHAHSDQMSCGQINSPLLAPKYHSAHVTVSRLMSKMYVLQTIVRQVHIICMYALVPIFLQSHINLKRGQNCKVQQYYNSLDKTIKDIKILWKNTFIYKVALFSRLINICLLNGMRCVAYWSVNST